MTRFGPRLPGLAAFAAAAGSLLLLATAPALAARHDGSQADNQPATREPAAEGSGPLRLRNINGYSVIDRQHLVLRAGASRRYLVTLQRRCFGLRSSHRLGLSLDTFGTIHNPRFEFVQTEDGRCYFDTIEEVESNDAARALIAARAEAADAESRRR